MKIKNNTKNLIPRKQIGGQIPKFEKPYATFSRLNWDKSITKGNSNYKNRQLNKAWGANGYTYRAVADKNGMVNVYRWKGHANDPQYGTEARKKAGNKYTYIDRHGNPYRVVGKGIYQFEGVPDELYWYGTNTGEAITPNNWSSRAKGNGDTGLRYNIKTGKYLKYNGTDWVDWTPHKSTDPEQSATQNPETQSNSTKGGTRGNSTSGTRGNARTTAKPAATTTITTPTTTPASTENTGSYTIQRGDTLGALAKQFGMSVDELARLNNISNPNRIYAGRTLITKAPTVETPDSKVETPNVPNYGYGVTDSNLKLGTDQQYYPSHNSDESLRSIFSKFGLNFDDYKQLTADKLPTNVAPVSQEVKTFNPGNTVQSPSYGALRDARLEDEALKRSKLLPLPFAKQGTKLIPKGQWGLVSKAAMEIGKRVPQARNAARTVIRYSLKRDPESALYGINRGYGLSKSQAQTAAKEWAPVYNEPTSGLISTVGTMARRLLPIAAVLTPNTAQAATMPKDENGVPRGLTYPRSIVQNRKK